MTSGKAVFEIKESEEAPAPGNALITRQIMLNGMRQETPRHKEIRRRLDFGKVVGIDADGGEKPLAVDWQKGKGNRTQITIVNGRVVNKNHPKIEVPVEDGTRKIRLSFKGRSVTRVFPFTIRNIPLP